MKAGRRAAVNAEQFQYDADFSDPIQNGWREWRWILERTGAILLTGLVSAVILFSLFDSIMQRRNSYDGLHIATFINLYNSGQPETPISSLEDAAALYQQLGGGDAIKLPFTRFEQALSSIKLQDYGYDIFTAVFSPLTAVPSSANEK